MTHSNTNLWCIQKQVRVECLHPGGGRREYVEEGEEEEEEGVWVGLQRNRQLSFTFRKMNVTG